jgi:acetylornithine/succinyldiaminopimelate/putrescine aminotransferase
MTAPNRLMTTYAPPPVTFVRGSGTELWDDAGKRYLDFLCGLAVTSLGHAHPAVAEAIAQQARTLLHVSNLFGTEPGPQVAATLDRLITAGGARSSGTAGGARSSGRVFFCNSGAEANEAAIKLARKRGGRGRHVVVSAWRSFHGRTLATLHATGQPEKHEAFQPLPEGFRHAAWTDAAGFERVLDDQVAAILLEPVQGEGGVNPGDVQFFRDIRRLCDERGIALIVDEVQTGLGRTGEWFGFQHFGIEPDIVTMAKALGNGVPIGACWARDDVRRPAARHRSSPRGAAGDGGDRRARPRREAQRVPPRAAVLRARCRRRARARVAARRRARTRVVGHAHCEGRGVRVSGRRPRAERHH